MKQFTACQKYVRLGSRKLRLVAQAVKNLTPQEAIKQLEFLNKRSSLPVLKTIKQAIANAKNPPAGGKSVKLEDLRFSEIQILKGPILKRWRAVSRGRAYKIHKPTSHIKVVLEAKNGSKS